MSLFNNSVMMGASAAGAYEIERSLRFNPDDSTFLNRTWSGDDANLQVQTYSFWVKRTALDSAHYVFTAWNNSNTDRIGFTSDNQLFIELKDGGSTEAEFHSKRVFRDPTNWYHIVVAFATTDSTEADRCKVYVNNELITDWDTNDTVGQNYSLDGFGRANKQHVIGAYASGSSSQNSHFSGYIAEFYFIDGQQLTPSSFGEEDTITGKWIPKKYVGTYGNKGWYINFKDNSDTTATTLGKDYSGNSQNFTPSGLVVSSGTGNDSVIDTPTNNFCTMNGLTSQNVTVSNGALTIAPTGNNASTFSTMQIPASGKWYFEMTKNSGDPMIAYSNQPSLPRNWQPHAETDALATYMYSNLQVISEGNTILNHSTSPWNDDANGTVFGILWDRDNDTIKHRFNNGNEVSLDIPSGLQGLPLAFGYSVTTTWPSGSFTYNFGAGGFAYTIPTGYKALSTANLPEPTIIKGSDYFNTVTYTGTGSDKVVTGVGFQADLVWIKNRTAAGNWHDVYDSIRGVTKRIFPNDDASEQTQSEGLKSFSSDGYTVGNNSDVGSNGAGYVGWNWKESATAGFDIVSYTGDGNSPRNVAHNLGVAPELVIIKKTSAADNWIVSIGPVLGSGNEGHYLKLNSSNTAGTSSVVFNDTNPTSSNIVLGDNTSVNNNGSTYMAYCFSSVEGYSKIDSFVANGSTNGPVVYTGFRPQFIMTKKADGTSHWYMWDTERQPHNEPERKVLWANLDDDEEDHSAYAIDFLSNGFKVRNSETDTNYNGSTQIFLAFAESPFKYSNAQ